MSQITVVSFFVILAYSLAKNSGSTGSPISTCSSSPLNFPIKFNKTYQANITEVNELKFNIPDLSMPIAKIATNSPPILTAMKIFDQLKGDEDEPTQEETNAIKFESNQIIVKNLNVSMFSFNLYTNSDPKCSLGILVKNITITGKFLYDGPLPLLSLAETNFVGYYKMQINDVYLTASTNLTKQALDENQVVEEPTKLAVQSRLYSKLPETEATSRFYSLVTSGLKMNISNFGKISIDVFDSPDYTAPSTNYLLKMLTRFMQRTIKTTYYMFEKDIRRVIEGESKKSIDCLLSRFNSYLETNSSYQSDLAKIFNNEIAKSKLNNVSLPNYEFQQKILGTNAKIYFTKGTLSGLDNLKLNGETRLKIKDQSLIVNSSVGWSDLHSNFDYSVHISNNKDSIANGQVSFNIKEFNFDTVITRGVGLNSRIVVDELIIKKMDGLKMDISGVPGLSLVTRGIINFFMRNFKQRLASSIQPVMQQQLEKSLNKLDIFA